MVEEHKFVIRPGTLTCAGVVQNIMHRIQQARGLLKPTEVVLRPYSPKRSGLQNDRLWALHTTYAKWLNEQQDEIKDKLREEIRALGKPEKLTQLLAEYVQLSHIWTPEDVHNQIFKPHYVHTRKERSSTRLSKVEMADAQTEYEAMMNERGIDTAWEGAA